MKHQTSHPSLEYKTRGEITIEFSLIARRLIHTKQWPIPQGVIDYVRLEEYWNAINRPGCIDFRNGKYTLKLKPFTKWLSRNIYRFYRHHCNLSKDQREIYFVIEGTMIKNQAMYESEPVIHHEIDCDNDDHLAIIEFPKLKQLLQYVA